MPNKWVDGLLEDILGRGRPDRRPAEEATAPAVDIYDTPEALVILAEMPGVDDKGVEVTLEDDSLVLSGQPADEPSAGETRYAERTRGRFVRRFRLDSMSFDREKVEAVMKNGILRVTLPKAAGARTHRIPVKGS